MNELEEKVSKVRNYRNTWALSLNKGVDFFHLSAFFKIIIDRNKTDQSLRDLSRIYNKFLEKEELNFQIIIWISTTLLKTQDGKEKCLNSHCSKLKFNIIKIMTSLALAKFLGPWFRPVLSEKEINVAHFTNKEWVSLGHQICLKF